ncbi:non-heme iron oxygenase ferredoxin subunit [Oscillochloris sp. ZM17-4]|uniref:Rieske (2Fe-2S) protein n=1 Tax=Oscillochloris sp. ZM17-4 TaxID=2866714 RepID=UPI001C73BCDC|nr:non-heme iron oxygenase ferredoxin subunit [Oscillochloris sp. ZM17-4]MBX0326744.1 non-heme iron oxygenase ferredoxin subunit [Oscillochloris sp. ZM17-4]
MAREWALALDLGAISPGQMAYVDVDGLPVALANVGGAIYAFGDSCRHEGGPLSSGLLIGEAVTCPWHGWAYSVRTGKSLIPPVGLRIPVYPVRVEDGQIWVGVDWPDA